MDCNSRYVYLHTPPICVLYHQYGYHIISYIYIYISPIPNNVLDEPPNSMMDEAIFSVKRRIRLKRGAATMGLGTSLSGRHRVFEAEGFLGRNQTTTNMPLNDMHSGIINGYHIVLYVVWLRYTLFVLKNWDGPPSGQINGKIISLQTNQCSAMEDPRSFESNDSCDIVCTRKEYSLVI